MSKKQRRHQSNKVEHEIKRLKEELALVSPPKVENRQVTVVQTFFVVRNSTAVSTDRMA